MADQIALRVAESQVTAGSAVSVTANFRSRATGVASTPTSIRYRVDCLTNHGNVVNWTSVSPADSVTISVAGGHNAIINRDNDYEKRQLLVEIDTGLDTQARQAIEWRVKNIRTFVPSLPFLDDLRLEPYYPQTAAEISAGITPTNFQYESLPIIDLRRHGLSASASGATNRAALESFVALAGTLGGAIGQAPPGDFAIDATVDIDANNTYIRGVGEATRWVFDPSGTDVLFNFDNGASPVSSGGILDCKFFSNNSNTKTAIRVNDGRRMLFQGLVMADAGWPGSASIGIHMLGREYITFHKNQLRCARPVVVDLNPNNSINCDFFKFHETSDGSTLSTGTCYEFVDGVFLSNLLFDHVSIVLGKWGIKWVDTTSGTASYNVTLRNVRTEQASDATGYSVELTSTAQRLQAVYFDNCYFDAARNGVKLRQFERATFVNSNFYGGSGRTNLDLDFETYSHLRLVNTHVQVASTVTLTDAQLIEAPPFNASETVMSKDAVYRFNEAAVVSQRPAYGYNGVKRWGYQATLAQSATLNLPLLEANETAAIISVVAYSATGPIHSGGSAIWTRNGALTKIGGASTFVVAGVTTPELRLVDGGSGVVLVNVLGQDVTVVIDVKYV